MLDRQHLLLYSDVYLVLWKQAELTIIKNEHVTGTDACKNHWFHRSYYSHACSLPNANSIRMGI